MNRRNSDGTQSSLTTVSNQTKGIQNGTDAEAILLNFSKVDKNFAPALGDRRVEQHSMPILGALGGIAESFQVTWNRRRMTRGSRMIAHLPWNPRSESRTSI